MSLSHNNSAKSCRRRHRQATSQLETDSASSLDYRVLGQAAGYVKSQWPDARPGAAVVLGSGWNNAVSAFSPYRQLDYADIPGLGSVTSIGHVGKLSLGEIAGVQTLIFQGRRHFYEGTGYTPMAVPIAIAKELGCSVMMLCNATGGMAEKLKPGDLMLVSDHINTSGSNPLIGPHVTGWGERFPDMSKVYDPALRELVREAAKQCGLQLKEGVVQVLGGPPYETPAEVRFMHSRLGDVVELQHRALLHLFERAKEMKVPGLSQDMLSALQAVSPEIFTEGRGDAAAMSIANGEAIMANAWGLRVVAISCIANFAAGRQDHPLTGPEVVKELNKVMPNIVKLLTATWGLMAEREFGS